MEITKIVSELSSKFNVYLKKLFINQQKFLFLLPVAYLMFFTLFNICHVFFPVFKTAFPTITLNQDKNNPFNAPPKFVFKTISSLVHDQISVCSFIFCLACSADAILENWKF